MIDKNFTEEELRNAIRQRVNTKFNDLRRERSSLEENWIKIYEAVKEGTFLSNSLREKVGKYVDLRDNSYSSLASQLIGQKLVYVKPDNFKLVPKPFSHGAGDIVKTDVIEHYLKDKFKNEECGFDEAFEDAIRQLVLFNFGVIGFSFCFKTGMKQTESYSIRDGSAVLESFEEENELTYQGTKLSFINIFNFYLDNSSYNFSDIYALDTFYRESREYQEVVSCDIFDSQKNYINQARVLFRDNKFLKEINQSSYSLSDSEKKLDKRSSQNQNGISDSNLKNYVEIRTCYLKALKVKGIEKESILNNICVIYAIQNEEVYPLLVEYNPRCFNKKPYVYLTGFKDGMTLYGSSELGRAYSDHAMSAFYKATKAYITGEATFATEYVDSNFMKHFQGSEIEFSEQFKKPGYTSFVDFKAYKNDMGDPSSPFTSPMRERALRILPLFSEARNESKGEMQAGTFELNSNPSAPRTASEVKYIATQQSVFQEKFKSMLGKAYKRIINLTIDDFKRLKDILQNETILKSLDRDALQGLFLDIKSGKAVIDQENNRIIKTDQAVSKDGLQMPIVQSVDMFTKQAFIEITPFFFKDLDVGIDVLVEGVDTDKAFENENITRLFDFAEKFQTPELGIFALKRYISNNDLVGADKILDILEAKLQAQAEQANQPPDPAIVQAQMEQQQAEIASKSATAQQKQASALKLGEEGREKKLQNDLKENLLNTL